MKPLQSLAHTSLYVSPNPPPKLPISLCLIVKNEEAVLPRCLLSAHALVKEMIVLDTGSTDATPYLARAYGARVYSYVWSDSFAAARNAVLDYAQEPWILMLDADEALDPSTWNDEGLQSLLHQDKISGYYIKLAHTEHKLSEPLEAKDIMAIDMSCRLFRNDARFRYRGRIHEDIASSIEAADEGLIGWSSLMIWHDGYTDHTIQQKHKQERNRRLLMLQMQDEPHEPLWWYAYGTEHFQVGEWQEAMPWLLQALTALREVKKRPGYLSDVWLKSVYALQRIGSIKEALALAEEGITAFPDFPDLLELTASLLSSMGCWQDSYICLERALQCGDVSHLYTTTATRTWRTHWLAATMIERATQDRVKQPPSEQDSNSLDCCPVTELHHPIHEEPSTLASRHFAQAAMMHPDPAIQLLFHAASAYHSRLYHKVIEHLTRFMDTAPWQTPFIYQALSFTYLRTAQVSLSYIPLPISTFPCHTLLWGDGIRPYLE